MKVVANKFLGGPAVQLQQIKESSDVRLKKPVELRNLIERENELFEEISRPLREAIRQFGTWRKAEIDSLILAAHSGARIHISPSMFSSRYLAQFSDELWYASQKGLDQISWPDSAFFDRQGLIVFLQVFLSLFLIIAVYRNRQVLKDSRRCRFLAARPFFTGLFFGSIVLALFYEYQRVQNASVVGLAIVAGICTQKAIPGTGLD